MVNSKSQRARAVLKRALKKKKQGGKNLYGIKQGVGAITKNAFPKSTKKSNGANKSKLQMKYGLNAMHPCHLPLPRAVGGYTIIRTTDIVNASEQAILFGVFKGPAQEFTETAWLSTIAVRHPAGGVGNPINGPSNAFFHNSAALEAASLNGARMVPAAITVQIMNGQALQNANGIAYIGRSKTVLDLMGDPRSWEDVMKELVSYSAPRLCSSGKLALRGVQVNAIPNNLSVLSDFVPRRNASPGVQTWTETEYPADMEGFAPIFVYNPDGIALKYLVTIEWRMRFDPLNPAYAGHVVHQPASESMWSNVVKDAEAAGNGVMDIADVTADIGMTAATIALLGG